MKTCNITLNLYQLDELSNKAKEKAIMEHRQFMISNMHYEAYITKFGFVMNNDEPVIDSIEANDYLFYKNGELAKTVTYCGTHPKSGLTELDLFGDTYELN